METRLPLRPGWLKFAILVIVNSIDPGQAIDLASKLLAGIVSLVGLVIVMSQWSRPAVLKRRVRWLHETIQYETDEARLATLNAMLHNANSSLIAGVLVPGWRFLSLAAVMLLGPLQAFFWVRQDADVWNVIGALGASLVISMIQIRRGVRFIAERYRVAHEYRAAAEPVRPPRRELIHQMEGGGRAEFGFGLAAAVGINAVAVGSALFYLEQVVWGLALGIAGALLTASLAWLIDDYARKRVGIYGPWSVEDARK